MTGNSAERVDIMRQRQARKKGAAKAIKPRAKKMVARSVAVARYLDSDGRVAIDRLTKEFRMSRARIAETIGVAAATLQRTARADAPKTQARLREMMEIVNRVSGWAGGQVQAIAWYRAEPIPEFGGRTAESLVKDGKAGAVRDYLDGVALGSFA
jgi:uncharacterized protein (DUF2384 family)